MSNINVSYDAMQTEAHGLRAGQQSITDELNKLRQRIDALVANGFVTDAASGAYQQAYQEFNHGAVQVISSLDTMAGKLEMAAQTLQETDQQLKGSMA